MKLYLRLRAQTLRGFFDRLKAAPYRGGPFSASRIDFFLSAFYRAVKP